jgi:hypothetical protein
MPAAVSEMYELTQIQSEDTYNTHNHTSIYYSIFLSF